MNMFSNIFVVLEANSTNQPALQRAQQIAELNGACITLCLGAKSRVAEICDEGQEPPDLDEVSTARQLLQKNCEDFLNQLAEPVRDKGIKVSFSIGWSDDAVSGIIQAAVSAGSDLLVKASRHHSKLKTLFYTPTDWKLLRKCPTPVLMVHSEKPHQPKQMLAAVSAISVDEEHHKLDHKVLQFASEISKLFHSNLKVINAYTPVALGVSLDGSGVYQEEYLQDLEKQHHNKTLELTRKFNIDDSHVETRNGDPNMAINEAVEELGIDLVILGTLAREGLVGLFVGNTAEQVLEKLDCEILTVKQ
jgi:universal stress protein E